MTLVKFHHPARPFLDQLWHAASNDLNGGSVFPKAQPAVNISQTDNGYRLEVAAPGLSKEDIAISLEKNILTIEALKKSDPVEKATETFLRREFSYQGFKQSFRLTNAIDTENVAAKLENGVLSIELNRKPVETPVVRTIPVL